MKEPLDWERIMKETQRGAWASAQSSERAVGGVSKVLEAQRRHSLKLDAIREEILQVRELLNAFPQSKTITESVPVETSRLLIPLFVGSLVIAAAAGASLGITFAS